MTMMMLSSFSFADSFRIAGKIHNFKEFKQVLISNCDKSCQAKELINKLDSKTSKLISIGTKKQFSQNLGSHACQYYLKGISVLGKSIGDKRPAAFCVLKDNSMIEISSLTSYIKAIK